ncbi:MAG: aminopeptidase [Clostridia bacterium]|nr:aminopeptidase [Lachnospiraceae bacterium]NCB99264.1 aminopeptidase [Clostridia bacterium]NCD01413.1 aminopeptidase [Clostridia bacterium]
MRENAWNTYTDTDTEMMDALITGYKYFLDNGKTERECVKQMIATARSCGYIPLEEVIRTGYMLKPGSKVYAQTKGKAVMFMHIGLLPIEDGMNILGAHIDSPRLDIKQNPLYEDTELAYLDTHYYGGIKKYQWVTLPLALHGTIVKKDGSHVEINIGEEENDPVFGVTDLLVHLSSKQLEKKGSVVIEGENLDILVGSRPLKESDEKDKVKANILQLLKEKYDIEEEDFISGEIEVVPAGKSRDFGLDRSMVMSYGQDDRVCAYTSLMAMLSVEQVNRTSAAIFVDKEEIGSVGASSMGSKFFENTVAEVLNSMGRYTDLSLRRILSRSKMLSSDVSAAFDPAYASVFEKKNSAYFGKGVVFNKYTGARGKSASNDAGAEYVARIRRIMDDHKVAYQMAEMGKVDAGGGNTIAWIPAAYDMDVIDCGVAVLSMHAPWEITSKADIYEAEKCYEAFLETVDWL